MRVAVSVMLLLLCFEESHADISGDGRNSYVGSARVVRVDPIVARHVERVPVELCAWEYTPARRRFSPGDNGSYTRRIKRCRTTRDARVRETITGYHVTLRFNGETFSRRTTEHPGARMPVQVEVVLLND